MSVTVSKPVVSGTNIYTHLTASTSKELSDMARRLKVPVKDTKHDLVPHLDLNPHKTELAVRYGALKEQK